MEAVWTRAQVLARIKDDFVDPVDIDTVSHLDMKALVRAIDPEGEYFDAQAFSELRGASEKPADVGLVLRRDGDAFRIADVVPGSPAAGAGLQPGDRIVDGVLPNGLTMPDGTTRISSLPRVPVRLTVLKQDPAGPMEITLRVSAERPQRVRLRESVPGYVDIRIGQFADGTGADLVARLNERFRQDVPKGLVLDLRDSTGGLLNEAVGIAAVFLPPGALVASFSGRSQHSRVSMHASPRDYLRFGADYMRSLPPDVKRVPLVVLVNARTAAGAEIVAAALQDHARAVVAGTGTFGRATIQTIFPLDGRTALKLTTARWVSPHGKSVHGTGLAPDVASHVKPGEAPQDAASGDSQLERALAILRSR